MHVVPSIPGFSAVSRELRAPLLRYLTRQVGDAAVAEDLCQETFIRIERGLADFEGRASLKTWAFAIANRVVVDYLRRGAQGVKFVAIDEAADMADTTASVDEQMAIDEMNSCVREFIDTLPPDYRSALILHDLEGMSVAETADITQCSLATAKIRIHRARRRLKAVLDQACDVYRDSDSVFRCARC
jgi:RNA polymerase sigma-70 factor (ECF subfamily)